MTDPTSSPGDATWRLISPADIPFVYELVTKVDPRWWRFSHHGLQPMRLLETAQTIGAGALVHDGAGRPVACAVLADAGASGTGTFEYYALPEPRAEEIARRLAPELLVAAFSGAPIRRLYHERFEHDADLLGETAELFETEVVYPEFALIAGRYESRTCLVLTRERFDAWRSAS